jgi:chorismate mutase/prephenate dehydratase
MTDPKEVVSLRERILALDREILERLDQRAKLSKRIHGLAEAGSSIDVNESEWLATLVGLSSGEMPKESLRAIFGEIRAAGRSLEQPARVAYVGPEGGFCHQTALTHFGAAMSGISSPGVKEALDEVVRGRAAYAVFPYESSVDGLAQPSISALARTELVLVAERVTAATYHLMSRGVPAADIEKVYATALGHASCQRFLDSELPRASVIDVRSPVVAAELAREEALSAALVPEACGTAAGLESLRANVADDSDLQIRFAIAGARPAMRSGNDVTCILFSVDDQPGSLFGVLRHFAERGVNLRKLQSRPVSHPSWDYVFYVELGAHVTERPVVTALEAIKRTTKYLKVLGSFPVAISQAEGSKPKASPGSGESS